MGFALLICRMRSRNSRSIFGRRCPMSGFPAPESFEPRAMPAQDRLRLHHLGQNESRFGQIDDYTNNARSLPCSRRRDGARLKANVELVAQKQIFSPSSLRPRLEQIGDEHCQQMEDRKHHVE